MNIGDTKLATDFTNIPSSVTDMSYLFANSYFEYFAYFDFLNCYKNVKDMSYMFKDCRGLGTSAFAFETAGVENMEGMFYNVNADDVKTDGKTDRLHSEFEELDLRSFDTRSVTNMKYMFKVDPGKESDLTTIYVDGDLWDTSKVEDGTDMFLRQTELVGGAGTEYDRENVGKEYAHIDGGASNPGYLSSGQNTGKAVFTENNGEITMTFYYDNKLHWFDPGIITIVKGPAVFSLDL